MNVREREWENEDKANARVREEWSGGRNKERLWGKSEKRRESYKKWRYRGKGKIGDTEERGKREKESN